MRRGEPLEGVEFFNQLSDDNEFCNYLGKSMLAAGRLEAELTKHLNTKGVDENTKKATLGKLIGYCKKHDLLGGVKFSLETVNYQRNYFAHNLFALFDGIIEPTILSRENLLDSDIDFYIERAIQLTDNLNVLADIISEKK